MTLPVRLNVSLNVKSMPGGSQEAAGLFQYLAERLIPRLETPYPTDLSPECCSMLSTLCLAQVRGHAQFVVVDRKPRLTVS